MSEATSGPAPPSTPSGGLSEAEAAARRAAGQGNVAPLRVGRTYAQIVRDNVFNLINLILFALGITLIVLGRYLDALVAVGVVLANTFVSLYQEVRAKRTLDRIAILTRPKATVVRDGQAREVDPDEIVVGDLLEVGSGDQFVVDGHLVADARMEIDESLLTGESDLVVKHGGDEVLSGSFVVTGGGRYVAEKVGQESFAADITARAQAPRRVLTPLQRQVRVIIDVFLVMVAALEAAVIVRALLGHTAFVETVRMSTVVVALVPNGLILAIALAYALGAVRMAGKGTLVQQANAVESLSNVDVLCTDKTGTLTTNAIRYHDLQALELPRKELERLLGVFAASAAELNKTTEALAATFAAERRPVVAEAPFSSQRKWSGLAFDGAGGSGEGGPAPGTYVLGAPEVLQPALRAGSSLGDRLGEWTAQGYRVLLFAGLAEAVTFSRDDESPPELPRDLRPLGLVCFSDELRPHVQETLREFKEASIAVKVISGDSPQTVAALATQAGLGRDLSAVTGQQLAGMSADDFADAAEDSSVFGRVTPDQKERLAQALRQRGRYVAMIGDGVNDVVALKQANLGVAMNSGSQAARAVAGLILIKDSFAALPDAFREGQRIRNGLQDVLEIFMVRIFGKALVIAAMLPFAGFPFAPRNSSLLSFLGAGVPVIGLTVWARARPPLKGSIFRPLARFSLPPVVVMIPIAVAINLLARSRAEAAFSAAHAGASSADAFAHALPIAQTATISFLILCSLLLIPFVAPPAPWFTGGAPLRGDWRPTWMAAALLALFAGLAAVPFSRHLFELSTLPVWEWVMVVLGAVVWSLLVRAVWRSTWLDRLLRTSPAES